MKRGRPLSDNAKKALSLCGAPTPARAVRAQLNLDEYSCGDLLRRLKDTGALIEVERKPLPGARRPVAFFVRADVANHYVVNPFQALNSALYGR